MAVALERLNFAWEVVTNQLRPSQCIQTVDPQSFSEALSVLRECNMDEVICDWFLESLRQDLSANISQNLWQNIQTEQLSDTQTFDTFASVIERLHEQLSIYLKVVERLDLLGLQTKSGHCVRYHVLLAFKAILFHRTSKLFHDMVHEFYSVAFRVYYNSSKDPDNEGEESDACSGCVQLSVDCCCQALMAKFHKVNTQLRELELLDRLSSQAVTSIIHQRIKLHIQNTCEGSFETSHLDSLQLWLEETVLKWLLIVYTCNDEVSDPATSDLSGHVSTYKDRLEYYMNETYAKIRIDELFTIIIEYPDSEPALLDLKCCLEKTDLRSHAIKTLKNALETRLLHPGVNTADILTAYISAIKALRVLDPTGVILELVCEPVRKYLRLREDTVRCIVSSLTEGDSSELAGELIRGQKLIVDENCASEEDEEDGQLWTPDPVDADPSKTSKSRRNSDIISMLVNIYGSKELFVKEYRNLLADRILTQFSYEYERELRYLELLKLRFGESELHDCQVMLKDVADSKRLNARIVEEKKAEEAPPADPEEIPVNALILSAQFWPQFREEKITLPDVLQHSLETYTKSFETLKGNRTLNWKSHLGVMEIEVELKGRTLNLNVSPVHAAILMQFQEKAKWTTEELSSTLQMPVSALRRKITYWQSMGLLKEESPDTFLLVEEHKNKGQEVMVVDEDETESAMASSHDQREEELQMFWQYIVGMLTNLESLPLERIHAILKMFASQGQSSQECSLEELKGFLDSKVKDQLLVYSGGVYRLPK